MASEIRFGTPSGTIERGATLTVPIVVALERATRVRGIRAKFLAAEETRADYTTSSTDSNGKVKTETRTAVETSAFAARDYLLAGGEGLGFLGSLKDGLATMLGGGKHDTLPAGEHPFSVEFQIPADGRPTHLGKKSRVYYELSVQVDIPLAGDLHGTWQFDLPWVAGPPPLTAPVRAAYPDEETNRRGLIDSMFGANVQLEVALKSDKFRLGETIEGLIGVQTAAPLNCRAVRARLAAVESTTAQGHTDSHRYTESAVEVDTPGEIVGEYSRRFSLPAEVQGPVSMRGDRFSVEWFVQVEIDLPWSKDPAIRVPIELRPRG